MSDVAIQGGRIARIAANIPRVLKQQFVATATVKGGIFLKGAPPPAGRGAPPPTATGAGRTGARQ